MKRRLLTLASALALAACGGDPETEAPPSAENAAGEAQENAATATERTAPQSEAVEESTTVEAADATPAGAGDANPVLVALGPDYAAADLTNGQRQYRRCQACHTLTEGGPNTVGPNLHGIIGEPAAARDGFAYSRQLQEAGLVWDVATLDAWLENPRALVPGNRMTFVGLRDPEARRDVIAYIAAESAQ